MNCNHRVDTYNQYRTDIYLKRARLMVSYSQPLVSSPVK